MTTHLHRRNTRLHRGLALVAPAVLALTLAAVPRTPSASAPVRPTAAATAAATAPTTSPVGPSQVIIDWERTSIRTIYTEAVSPVPVGTLYLGFTSLAMYDAVNRAHRHHGSGVAAAAVAAHDVLADYFPASMTALDADLATSLAGVADSWKKRRGIRAGTAAADAMIASRVDDGRDDASIVYLRDPAPGVWQPAPGGAMLAAWLGYVKPLVLRHLVPTNGPDPLTSRSYAADYDEVRRLGSAASTERSALQTETARFFSINPAAMLGQGLLTHLESEPLSLRRTALLFAALHGAVADSIINAWLLKYEVGFWRPNEAVAGADTDGNDATVAETGWVSLLTTPPYSDYVSGHSAITGPTAEVIRRMLGEDTELTLTSSVTGTSRTYSTLSSLEEDALNSRVWGGLHFRDAMDDGYQAGHRAAARALARLY